MPRKRTLFVAVLVTALFATGAVFAADRDVSARKQVRGEVTAQLQVQPAGPASAIQILRLRLLETIRLVKALQPTRDGGRAGGASFDGLSDGPDPIDGGSQASQMPGDPHHASEEMPEVIPPDGGPTEPYVNLGAH